MAFDLNVHVRDKKGRIVQENHYVMVIENGVKKIERNGVWYHEDGTEIKKATKAVPVAEVSAAEETAKLDDLLPKTFKK